MNEESNRHLVTQLHGLGCVHLLTPDGCWVSPPTSFQTDVLHSNQQ